MKYLLGLMYPPNGGRLALKTTLILALLAGAMAGPARAQVQFVSVEPECRMYFSYSAIGVSGSFDNRTRGCDFWVVSYSSFTFAGPLSLSLQAAPNAAGSVPGIWAGFPGTITAGVNPNVSLVGAETQASGYYPWIRMNLTATGAGAGLVVGTAYGWRTGPPSSTSILGVVNTNLSQYGGVAVGPTNPVYTSSVCTLSAPVAVSAAGATQIVGLVAAQSIRVCHISVSMQAPVDLGLIRGTGVNCAGAPANVTGTYSTVLALGLDFSSPLVVTAANALCVNLGAAVTGGGVIRYAQY